MQISHNKIFKYTPFSISTEEVKNSPGTWDSIKVSIFRDERLIGEYLRNYASYGTHTFYPFKANNEWYALYSANYTATRVMKLHSDRIEDWCGETPMSNGFCPVEYYIPTYIHTIDSYIIRGEKKEFDNFTVDCDCSEEEFEEELNSPGLVKLANTNFAFLSGCVWGDDISWKLRYIDLSKIPDRVLEISDKFGYCQLPQELTLKQCIHMEGWEPNHNWVRIIKSNVHNIETGETY